MFERLIQILSYDPKNPLIFSSGLFLFLFFGFSFIYMLLQHRSNLRILFVTLFSYYFYYKSSGFYFFLLAVITTSDYFIAEAIGRIKGDSDIKTRKMKILMVTSLCIDLGFLAYFKYTNFFAGLIADLIGKNFQPWDIFLPVGISFFTFQSMSYVIDVYRGKIKPLGSLMDYAFYVSFFPQLVAGPIVRATDFAPQIRKPVVITREMFARGVYFIMIGLFKKAVISDYISLNFVDRIFDNPTLYSGFENLLGVYGYAMQIYCDFSGYSDMAIGIALLLGFHFPLNFNAPYKSDSITDFWLLAHLALHMDTRLYLYLTGRQPQRQTPAIHQPCHHHAARWSLARSQSQLRGMGRHSRSRPGRPQISVARGASSRPPLSSSWLAQGRSHRAHLPFRMLHLAVLP